MGRNRISQQDRREQKSKRRLDGHDSSVGKEKFQEDRLEKARSKEIKPMNKKQDGYLKALNDPDISVIIATGYAGSSKCINKDSLIRFGGGLKYIESFDPCR